MGVRIYQLSGFDLLFKERLFRQVGSFLETCCQQETVEACLIGNYVIGEMTVDALLITGSQMRILQFREGEGQVIARTDGAWTIDGRMVGGGVWQRNPYRQAVVERRKVMGRFPSIPVEALGVTILFGCLRGLDDRSLPESARGWLTVTDPDHLDSLWTADERHVLFSSDDLARFVAGLELPDTEPASRQERAEPASSYFDELRFAMSLEPDYVRVYRLFAQTFRKFLSQHTAFSSLRFGGAFARTDYLLKEYEADRLTRKMVNDVRVRIRNFGRDESSVKFSSLICLYDLEALCRFVSLVYGVTIPEDLGGRFRSREPDEDVRIASTNDQPLGDRIRIVVDSWDEHFLYGQVDWDEMDETRVAYTENAYYPYDWSYLGRMLYRGAQLNLVRPRRRDGVIYPELIIFEPDYLVDISAVAACFENYATSPMIHLLNKIKPSASSEAILLGNFAGQLLDEAIHSDKDAPTYLESATRFFRHNTLGMLTQEIGRHFHEEAQAQKRHIGEAIDSLSGHVGAFDRDEVILEPSFFSEMLGLQGRMDLLQLDFRFLVEQKSGKSAYPYPRSEGEAPRQQEKHYVQMLLYMLLIRYNYRAIYERNGQNLQAYLLYSKYRPSLCGLGFAPRLIFEAIKVRNGMVWSDLLYAQGGFEILNDLSADRLNTNQVSGTLWEQYQKPQIDALLTPIHKASDLERAYYYRFLTFIGKEHQLSKIGNSRKECSGFASTWLDLPEEKSQAGNMFDGLTIESPDEGHVGAVEHVALRFQTDRDKDRANFRRGDIVFLYPYAVGTSPDPCSTMVFRGLIEELTDEMVILHLRAKQSDARVFRHYAGCLWAVEHDFMESSYQSLYRGMHAFLSAPRERKELLLLQRKPVVDRGVTLNGDYGAFNALSLRVKQARELFLIVGPPGTGKTSYGLMNTLLEELTEPDASVLLLAYTNRAVDEICSKLVGQGLDFIRIGSRFSADKAYHPYLLEEKVADCPNRTALLHLVATARIIVGTTTTLSANLSLFGLRTFSLAVIDEASQILEPHLMGLLSASRNGCPAICKIVMIGDHKQLPAVVQQTVSESAVVDPALHAIRLTNCRLSLFERLLSQYGEDPEVTYMLTRQGRMHPDIALFPNQAFYGGRLEAVPCPHQSLSLPSEGKGEHGIDDLLMTRRVVFVAVSPLNPEAIVSDKVNQPEAEVIAATVYRIYLLEGERFDVDETVGVIVPYRNQIATVRAAIARYGIPALRDITIDTVERYQGSQRDYILYGFTVQKYYQLDFLTDNTFEEAGVLIDRKLNVAMTRAREHLLLIGNPGLLGHNIIFRQLIEFVRERGGFLDIPVDQYISGNFRL